eukprot:GILK01008203.1.p1 GENE.GILK01008203.1~~GILK01008203.1.p1  ORF type:complete len:1332 (-),score=306.23 GILK01008203.1:121-4116(-)
MKTLVVCLLVWLTLSGNHLAAHGYGGFRKRAKNKDAIEEASGMSAATEEDEEAQNMIATFMELDRHLDAAHHQLAFGLDPVSLMLVAAVLYTVKGVVDMYSFARLGSIKKRIKMAMASQMKQMRNDCLMLRLIRDQTLKQQFTVRVTVESALYFLAKNKQTLMPANRRLSKEQYDKEVLLTIEHITKLVKEMHQAQRAVRDALDKGTSQACEQMGEAAAYMYDFYHKVEQKAEDLKVSIMLSGISAIGAVAGAAGLSGPAEGAVSTLNVAQQTVAATAAIGDQALDMTLQKKISIADATNLVKTGLNSVIKVAKSAQVLQGVAMSAMLMFAGFMAVGAASIALIRSVNQAREVHRMVDKSEFMLAKVDYDSKVRTFHQCKLMISAYAQQEAQMVTSQLSLLSLEQLFDSSKEIRFATSQWYGPFLFAFRKFCALQNPNLCLRLMQEIGYEGLVRLGWTDKRIEKNLKRYKYGLITDFAHSQTREDAIKLYSLGYLPIYWMEPQKGDSTYNTVEGTHVGLWVCRACGDHHISDVAWTEDVDKACDAFCGRSVVEKEEEEEMKEEKEFESAEQASLSETVADADGQGTAEGQSSAAKAGTNETETVSSSPSATDKSAKEVNKDAQKSEKPTKPKKSWKKKFIDGMLMREQETNELSQVKSKSHCRQRCQSVSFDDNKYIVYLKHPTFETDLQDDDIDVDLKNINNIDFYESTVISESLKQVHRVRNQVSFLTDVKIERESTRTWRKFQEDAAAMSKLGYWKINDVSTAKKGTWAVLRDSAIEYGKERADKLRSFVNSADEATAKARGKKKSKSGAKPSSTVNSLHAEKEAKKQKKRKAKPAFTNNGTRILAPAAYAYYGPIDTSWEESPPNSSEAEQRRLYWLSTEGQACRMLMHDENYQRVKGRAPYYELHQNIAKQKMKLTTKHTFLKLWISKHPRSFELPVGCQLLAEGFVEDPMFEKMQSVHALTFNSATQPVKKSVFLDALGYTSFDLRSSKTGNLISWKLLVKQVLPDVGKSEPIRQVSTKSIARHMQKTLGDLNDVQKLIDKQYNEMLCRPQSCYYAGEEPFNTTQVAGKTRKEWPPAHRVFELNQTISDFVMNREKNLFALEPTVDGRKPFYVKNKDRYKLNCYPSKDPKKKSSCLMAPSVVSYFFRMEPKEFHKENCPDGVTLQLAKDVPVTACHDINMPQDVPYDSVVLEAILGTNNNADSFKAYVKDFKLQIAAVQNGYTLWEPDHRPGFEYHYVIMSDKEKEKYNYRYYERIWVRSDLRLKEARGSICKDPLGPDTEPDPQPTPEAEATQEPPAEPSILPAHATTVPAHEVDAAAAVESFL